MADVLLLEIIDIQFVATGFLGGMLHAINAEKVEPWEVVRSMVVGGIVGNFFTIGLVMSGLLGIFQVRVFGVWVGLPPVVVAFCAGLTGRRLSSWLEVAFMGLLRKIENE